MASREVIDLTEPEVIELDSDGDEVNGGPSANGSGSGSARTLQENGGQQPGKKKRKKKRRKPGAQVNQDEPVGSTMTSTEVSRPESLDGQDEPEIIEVVKDKQAGGSGSDKRPLEDRLSGNAQVVPEGEGRRRRDQKGKEKEKEKERRRDDGREKDRERDRHRDRDRRRSRSPRHDHDRERESRRRSRSRDYGRDRDRDRRVRDRTPERDVWLFFEDVTPAEVPAGVKFRTAVAGPSRLTSTDGQAGNGLILPAHVSVAEGAEAEALELGPLKVPTPPPDSDEEDYIDYLDYDDNLKAGMVRYWELDKLEAQEAKASKSVRIVCKKCGAEGEHKTHECTVVICLTCGARDDHPTRSCPISKVCFTCGMKGHINKTCPNRGKPGAYQGFHDCDRCGARTHQTNECPTLWRMYKYVEDEERQEVLRAREGKRMLAFGQGGEGYIAPDEWCYNCGDCGHLGDDCTAADYRPDLPNEPSAFSLYNVLSGPFSEDAPRAPKRAPRDWETASAFADGYGATVPTDVGKQGRRKERERLGKARELQEAGDDQDNWFDRASYSRGRNDARDSRGASRNGGGGGGGGGGGSKANGKFKFNFAGSSIGGGGGGERGGKRQRPYDNLPEPSKETDSLQIRGAARKHSYRSTSSKDRHHDRHDRHARERSHNRYESERESQRGPRYRGGYRQPG
ncbi:transcription factor [Ganoderma sinense ZZ0214-1]|uniref:Transcription factor n=1 Tax=Ganoderma sinense ZZ0214-1 TaxID=1077348 RepID=A0A2G8SUS7_9APHY|nr:transcription factor [Ganoderma sinense ZZ0214-1]